jgi:tetratricopeptide (TPR) repeat protein
MATSEGHASLEVHGRCPQGLRALKQHKDPATLSADRRSVRARARLSTPGAIMGLSFAVALIVRGVYLFFLRESPYFDVPIVDSQWHDTWARDWAQGTWSMGGRAFFRAPLYPFFLSLIYRLAGNDLVAARVVQAIIGSGTAAAISGCGWRIGGRSVALWSGMMSALFGTLVFYDGELLIPNLLVALLSWALFFLLSKRAGIGHILAAFLVGMAAVARPNALVLLPLCLFFTWTRVRGGLRDRVRVLAVAALAASIPIGVVTTANYRAERTFVLIASQGGVNLYAGNNAGATGSTAAIDELADVSNSWNEFVDAARRLAEEGSGRPLNSREVSGFWARKAWRWMVGHPLDAVRLNFKKAYLLIQGYEVPNNRDLYYGRAFPLTILLWKLPWLFFPWGIVFPLAVLGAVVGMKDRRMRGKVAIVTAWVLAYALSLLPFFVCARFRMGMVPGVILLAGVALSRGRKLCRTPLLAVAILTLVLVNANLYGTATDNVAQERGRMGVALLRAGKFERGREELRAALQARPEGPRSASYLAEYAFLLGQSYQGEGNREEALHYFRYSLKLGLRSFGSLVTMANCLAGMGEHGDAVLALEKAASLRPADGVVWADLGVGYENDGKVEQAVGAYVRSIQLSPTSPRAYLRLGALYERREQPDYAIAVWRRGAGRIPEEFTFHFNLALAYARQERFRLALEEVDAALERRPDSEEAASLRQLLEEELREGRESP